MRASNCAALLFAVMACQPRNQSPPTPAGGDPVNATVHAILTDPSLVGRMVRVTGTCLGYSVPTVAKGSPPLTRSDWQLEDQGEAMWVTGPMPAGCSATEPAGTPSTIVGSVAQDTLPGLGGQAPSPRRYLVSS